MDKDQRIADLEKALKGMFAHCSCQGRGYHSWSDGRIVRRCQNSTCIRAREVLGIPEENFVTAYEERMKKEQAQQENIEYTDQDDVELTVEQVKEMADRLAKKVDADDRFDMFRRFDNDEYDGLDIEITISCYKHLLETYDVKK